ncbi:MAG TPA: hypothetical protein VF799_03615, partial [Geobacteraceae bacterium]
TVFAPLRKVYPPTSNMQQNWKPEIVSIRKLLHLPEETGRGFPETSGTAFEQALVMEEDAGIAGSFAQYGISRQITVRWRKVPARLLSPFRMKIFKLIIS